VVLISRGFRIQLDQCSAEVIYCRLPDITDFLSHQHRHYSRRHGNVKFIVYIGVSTIVVYIVVRDKSVRLWSSVDPVNKQQFIYAHPTGRNQDATCPATQHIIEQLGSEPCTRCDASGYLSLPASATCSQTRTLSLGIC